MSNILCVFSTYYFEIRFCIFNPLSSVIRHHSFYHRNSYVDKTLDIFKLPQKIIIEKFFVEIFA